MSGERVPEHSGEDVEEALTSSFAAKLKAQVTKTATATEKFVLLAGEEKGELTITIVARKVIDGKDMARAANQSDGAFIVESTDHVLIDDGERTLTRDWPGVQRLLGLPANFTIDQTPKAATGGSELVVSSVAEEILEWMRSSTARAAARMGS